MTKPTCAVCVTFQVKPEHFDEFLDRVKQQANDSLSKEAWCHQFDVSTREDAPFEVLLYETYDDRTAFLEKHRQTDHFAEFNATVSDWIAAKQVGVWDIG